MWAGGEKMPIATPWSRPNTFSSRLPSGATSPSLRLPCRSTISNVRKDAEQLLPHQAERGVVEIAVVGDEADDAAAGLLDVPLGQADELDVVVVQPGLPLAEPLAAGPHVAADLVVAAHEPGDPVVGVGGEAGEGRVAEDDGNCRIADCGLQIADCGSEGVAAVDVRCGRRGGSRSRFRPA